MTRQDAFLQVLHDTPGLTARQAYAELPPEVSCGLNAAYALLGAMCATGYARREKAIGSNVYRYFSTGKQAPARPPRECERVRNMRKNEARRIRRALAAAARPPRKPKPTSAQQFRMTPPTRPARPACHTAQQETVAEFLARGGIVQVLPLGACARSELRFDHSHTHIDKRHPNVRARPHAAHA